MITPLFRSGLNGELPPSPLIDELTDLRQHVMAGGVAIGYMLLNRRIDAKPIVAINGFMSDLASSDGAYFGSNLAALERPVLMLELPGHGRSTPHTSRQIIDLCFRQNANSQAEPLVETVDHIFSGPDQFDMVGISHGALMAVKIAELDPAARARRLLGIDLPAVRNRNTLELQVSYMVLESIIGKRRSTDAMRRTGLMEDFEVFKKTYEALGVQRSLPFYRKNPGLFFLNLFRSINASDEGLKSLRAVLANTYTEVELKTSEKGRISNPANIAKFITELPPEQARRVHQEIILGEDHNLGRTELLPRVAAWSKQFFDETKAA